MKRINLKTIDLSKISQKDSYQGLSLKTAYIKTTKRLNKLHYYAKSKYNTTLEQFSLIEKYNFVIYILLCCGIILTTAFSVPGLIEVFEYQEKSLIRKSEISFLSNSLNTLEKIKHKAAPALDKAQKSKLAIPDNPLQEQVIIDLGNLISLNSIHSPNKYSWEKLGSDIKSKSISDNFDVYKYDVSGKGLLDNILSLISDIRSNIRIMDIKSLKISPMPDGEVNFDISLWTYNNKTGSN